MSKKKEYPGMLLYFNRIEGIADRLNDQELGMIFRAMFNYARFGTEPESLEDKYYLIWPLLKDMLDNDRTRYEDTCRTNAYNSACKNAKVNNQPKPDKEEFERQYNMVKKTNSPERLQEQEQNELRNKALNRLKEHNPNIDTGGPLTQTNGLLPLGG